MRLPPQRHEPSHSFSSQQWTGQTGAENTPQGSGASGPAPDSVASGAAEWYGQYTATYEPEKQEVEPVQQAESSAAQDHAASAPPSAPAVFVPKVVQVGPPSTGAVPPASSAPSTYDQPGTEAQHEWAAHTYADSAAYNYAAATESEPLPAHATADALAYTADANAHAHAVAAGHPMAGEDHNAARHSRGSRNDESYATNGDNSFTTAPVAHTDALGHAEHDAPPVPNMPHDADYSLVSNAESGPTADHAFGADALIRPYDTSMDSVATMETAAPWLRRSHSHSRNPYLSPRLKQQADSPSAASTTVPAPETRPSETSAAEVPAKGTMLAYETHAPAATAQGSVASDHRVRPAIDMKLLAGLAPVAGLGPVMGKAASPPSGPAPASYSTTTSPPWRNVTSFETTQARGAEAEGTEAPETTSSTAVKPGASNVVVSQAAMSKPYTSTPVEEREAATSTLPPPVAPVPAPVVASSSAPVSPPASAPVSAPGSAVVPATATMASAAAPASLAPLMVATETFRVESFMGHHIYLHHDASTREDGPVPLAYTMDSWYLEPLSSAQGASDQTSAVVATSPTGMQAALAPLHLAVFSSDVQRASDGAYMLDVAKRIHFAVAPTRPEASVSRPMSLSQCIRNARVFGTSPRVVLAATPHRLVAEMTSGSAPGLMQDVFVGYRQFLDATYLFNLLTQRMAWAIQAVGEPTTFKTALQVLLLTQAALWHWLTYYFQHDFRPRDTLMRRLAEWAAHQEATASHWQYAQDPRPFVASLLQPPTPEFGSADDDEMPSKDPRERVRAISELVHDVVPPSLQPTQVHAMDPADSAAAVAAQPTSELRKARSFSNMLSLRPSTRRQKRSGAAGGATADKAASGHGRKPSQPMPSAGPGAASGAGAMPSMQGTPRSMGMADMSGASASSPSPILPESPDVSGGAPSSARRSRSLRSLKKVLRRTDGEHGAADSSQSSLHRKRETLTAEELIDTDDGEQDAALQRLENALTDTPRPDDVLSPRSRDGPIQWIPSHTGASWKEAQRLSMLGTYPKRPAEGQDSQAEPLATSESLLLSQRSSTIARQLGSIERQILSSISWTELADLSWDQHTVHQEQWQREYQDYVMKRIRSATESAGSPAASAPIVPAHGVHVLVARFNRACAWVSTHIVSATDVEQRAALVNKFIRIAWHCYRQGNIETLCQIMFGLQSPWVARLQQTWARVALWELRAFDALRRFTSPSNQFAYLRQSMREALDHNVTPRRFSVASTSGAPYVPFFGLFVSDLSNVDALSSYVDASLMPTIMPRYDESKASQDGNAMVNVYRLRLKALIVREFVTFQRHEQDIPFSQTELPVLIEALQLDTLPAVAIQRYVP